MAHSDIQTRLYGTQDPADDLRQIAVGPLSFLYSCDGLRRISWHGTELVRAIAWPIRDANWGTYPPEVLSESLQETPDAVTCALSFAVAGGGLRCDVTVVAGANGVMRADMVMTPTGAGFATNRAGFTVLHPIRGVAGAPLTVTHSDGRRDNVTFPDLISPGQPVFDIAGLAYGIDGEAVDIRFEGEVFEMEDQRNWSDASYKTYCVPLVHPFTYEITEPVTQTIHVTLTGDAAKDRATTASGQLVIGASLAPAPDLGLAIEPGWLEDGTAREAILQAGAAHLLVRIPSDPPAGYLAECAALARDLGAAVDVEIILADTADPETALREIAQAMAKAGLTPKRALALRAGYLASHQPSGPWPKGPTPNDVMRAARSALANTPDGPAIGGGMMTNFTEFNRCRPDTSLCDYVTHANTAIVHAGDDMSVLETLETLPQIFASAAALSAGLPYRLGLVSIGMRTNPYGAAVAENPDQIRRTMARIDPRQRGLFAAAWAVGVLAATADSKVDALCLAAPTGPFGIVYTAQDHPQVGYDATTAVYPLFHVIRMAHSMAGATRLTMTGLPAPLVAYGVRDAAADRMMIANPSANAQTLTLPTPARIRQLDANSFDQAIRDPLWLDTASTTETAEIDLPPFALAFVHSGH